MYINFLLCVLHILIFQILFSYVSSGSIVPWQSYVHVGHAWVKQQLQIPTLHVFILKIQPQECP